MGRRASTYVVIWIVLLILALVILPALVIAIIAAEHLAFGTRYFLDGAEAIGLTPLLQALFDFLDING